MNYTSEHIAKIIFNLGKLHERGEIDNDLSKSESLIKEYAKRKCAEQKQACKENATGFENDGLARKLILEAPKPKFD